MDNKTSDEALMDVRRAMVQSVNINFTRLTREVLNSKLPFGAHWTVQLSFDNWTTNEFGLALEDIFGRFNRVGEILVPQQSHHVKIGSVTLCLRLQSRRCWIAILQCFQILVSNSSCLTHRVLNHTLHFSDCQTLCTGIRSWKSLINQLANFALHVLDSGFWITLFLGSDCAIS